MFRPDPKPTKTKHQNAYKCSSGATITESQIQVLLSKSYREQGNQAELCKGCGKQAINHAHIIAKARCKVLSITELIWNPINYFPACKDCHDATEAISNGKWALLNNAEHMLGLAAEYDLEKYVKMCASLKNPDKIEAL